MRAGLAEANTSKTKRTSRIRIAMKLVNSSYFKVACQDSLWFNDTMPGMNLVIVESPTKARTLGKYLGEEYNVEASYGHVRDLPEKRMGVVITSPENEDAPGWHFEPEYVQTGKQKGRVEEIRKLAEKSDRVYLATDPDREGEAIAWHVVMLLNSKIKGQNSNQIPNSNFKRIVFHEITESAVQEALSHPGQINMRLVEAQQARRVVDRLVGYKLSPLLWRKVRRGLSAGRVQSVAVRLVVEREREIAAFIPEEYWIIMVKLHNFQFSIFNVQLVEKNEEKLKITNGQEAGIAEQDLRKAEYTVDGVEKKDFRRSPPAPFTTSTLQQAAANRIGWSAKRTMQVAQALYEQGYITYHRTDSTNLAVEALRSAARFIGNEYGSEYALKIPRMYKTKSKLSQEAHEAIRPTKVDTVPDSQGLGLNRDEARLYEMVWKRFVACQMAETRGVSVRVSVSGKAGGAVYGLEAKGETISFEGWLRLYKSNSKFKDQNSSEVNGENEATVDERIPEVSEGEKLEFVDIKSEQKFTLPPARYSDASLIKTLEEKGIGRPSTYAPTLSTIQERQYVEKVEKRFHPTALGVAVNDFLADNFANIIDYGFTAKMEDELDAIAVGEREWQPVVGEFYEPFEKHLEQVSDTAQRVKVGVEETGNPCPKCTSAGSMPVGREIVRIGRYGKFLACSRYPECDYRANFVNKTGIKCPKCGGDVILRRTKSRKSFYGCSNYPKCDFASWTRPTPKASEMTDKLKGEVK